MSNTNCQVIRVTYGKIKLFANATTQKQAASRKVGEDDPVDASVIWCTASFQLDSKGGHFKDDPQHREHPT